MQSQDYEKLIRQMPQIIVKGEVKERTVPGKDGKPGFKFRQQAALLCAFDGDDELKAKCVVDVPAEADPYLPGRYLIGGPSCFETADFGALSFNRRGVLLIPLEEPVKKTGMGSL